MKSIPSFQTIDIYTRVCMLVDNELPAKEAQILLAEINANPEYLRIYEQEKKFRSFLKKNISPRKAPEALVKSLKAQIHLTPHRSADSE